MTAEKLNPWEHAVAVSAATVRERVLADEMGITPVLLMVSGGSDSTALAYIAEELRQQQVIGQTAILHVNHHLRGEDSDGDAAFVAELADSLGMPLFMCDVDIAGMVEAEHGNMEAIARRERYAAAQTALESLCAHGSLGGRPVPVDQGRIWVAHTQDDRAENFYMRSIVGTGPGGFRSMTYRTGAVCRPLLDLSREDLRDAIRSKVTALSPAVAAESSLIRASHPMRPPSAGSCGTRPLRGLKQSSDPPASAVASAPQGLSSDSAATAGDRAVALWREDATNACTDQFRAYVRHEILPLAKARNPRLLDTLSRSMNLLADEDDFMNNLACEAFFADVTWLDERTHKMASGLAVRVEDGKRAADDAATWFFGRDLPFKDGCVLEPELGERPVPLRRRVVTLVLAAMLGPDPRVETASVEAVLAAFDKNSKPISGYVTNIQGDIAISANKRGVRIEPMKAFRARRKRG